PSTGCLKMPVVTSRSFQRTLRGRPTFTETTRIAPPSVVAGAMVTATPFPNLSPIFLSLVAMAQAGGTRIQLCGRFVVRLDGQRVEGALPGAKGQLLFAYLVLNRLRRIDRDEL